MHSSETHLGWRPASTDASGDADHLLIQGEWAESFSSNDKAPSQPIVTFTNIDRVESERTSPSEAKLPSPTDNQELVFSNVQDQGVTSPTILWDANDSLDDIATSNEPITFGRTMETHADTDQGSQTLFS